MFLWPESVPPPSPTLTGKNETKDIKILPQQPHWADLDLPPGGRGKGALTGSGEMLKLRAYLSPHASEAAASLWGRVGGRFATAPSFCFAF